MNLQNISTKSGHVVSRSVLGSKPFTLSQTGPGFYMSAVQLFRKHRGKRRNIEVKSSLHRYRKLGLWSDTGAQAPLVTVHCTSHLKTLWEYEKLLITSNFTFSHRAFYPLKNFLSFSSNLKLSSANSFRLEGSKICRLGKG